MEIKRNGKVEHSDATHDDQVFSMLMALYVWYEGVNLGERYGIRKTEIKTDTDEIDEALELGSDSTVEIVDEFNQEDEFEQDINAAANMMASSGMLMKDWIEQEEAKDKAAMDNLLNTPVGQRAYRQKYSIPDNVPLNIANGTTYEVPDSVFNSYYSDDDDIAQYNALMGNSNPYYSPEQMQDPMNMVGYNYHDNFNF